MLSSTIGHTQNGFDLPARLKSIYRNLARRAGLATEPKVMKLMDKQAAELGTNISDTPHLVDQFREGSLNRLFQPIENNVARLETDVPTITNALISSAGQCMVQRDSLYPTQAKYHFMSPSNQMCLTKSEDFGRPRRVERGNLVQSVTGIPLENIITELRKMGKLDEVESYSSHPKKVNDSFATVSNIALASFNIYARGDSSVPFTLKTENRAAA